VNILREVFNPIYTTLVAASLLDALQPSELSQRRVARFFRFHAPVDVLLRLQLDVRTHLVVHLRVELFLLKQHPKPLLNPSRPTHGQSRITLF
jgi:hypothetical protein